MNDTEMESGNPSDASNREDALHVLRTAPKLKRLEGLLAEFNLFDMLGIARSELQHSRVVAWLLDPRGSHGLGDLFLRGFLRGVAKSADTFGIHAITVSDIDSWNFSQAKVFLEHHNIDILLIVEGSRIVCLIENKVGSDEHSDQLSRYLKTVTRTYSNLRPLPVFLTPEGVQPTKERDAKRYVPVGYGLIADLLESIFRSRGTGIEQRVADFLKQYELTLRRRVLSTPSDIDRLAYEIYNDHKKAIDLIFKARSKRTTVDWGIIEETVKQFAPDLEFVSRTARILTYAPRSLSDVEELKEGETSRMVELDFLYFDNSVRLRLMVGEGPRETRERLFELAPTDIYDPRDSQSLDDKAFRLYWKQFLSEEDCNPFEPEVTRIKTEAEIKEFYEGDYRLLVNAIRAAFGPK